ncbi:MAG: VanZ family protein [Clostridiales bacterium]|nr:VanZ family protein [Clostridiales bacterium]
MFISKHKKSIRTLCWILFFVYIAVLVYFLFFSEMLGRVGTKRVYCYNLIPFREIRRFLTYRAQLGFPAVFLNLAGNILIFMPFGFLLPTMSRKLRGFFRVVLLGFELSLAVECVQLVTRTGSFDVDDMILNTLGSVIGVLIYMVVQHRRDVEADRRRAQLREIRDRSCP